MAAAGLSETASHRLSQQQTCGCRTSCSQADAAPWGAAPLHWLELICSQASPAFNSLEIPLGGGLWAAPNCCADSCFGAAAEQLMAWETGHVWCSQARLWPIQGLGQGRCWEAFRAVNDGESDLGDAQGRGGNISS